MNVTKFVKAGIRETCEKTGLAICAKSLTSKPYSTLFRIWSCERQTSFMAFSMPFWVRKLSIRSFWPSSTFGKSGRTRILVLTQFRMSETNEDSCEWKALFNKWLSSSVKPTASNSRYSSLVGHQRVYINESHPISPRTNWFAWPVIRQLPRGRSNPNKLFGRRRNRNVQYY